MGGTPTLQLHAHAGTVTPTALVAHAESHSGTRVPTQAPRGGGSAHGHCAHATPSPSLWGRHDESVGTCGDTRGGMVLAGCWALQPGFGGLTGERGSARLPPCTRDAHACSPAHTSTGVPTHTRVPHTLPITALLACPLPCQDVPRWKMGRKIWGKANGRKERGNDWADKREPPTPSQATGSGDCSGGCGSPSGRRSAAAAHVATQPGAGQHLQCRER